MSSQAANSDKLSDVVKGLQIHLDMPEGSYKAGDALKLKLHFKNAGKEKLRFYLVETEVFRFGQRTC